MTDEAKYQGQGARDDWWKGLRRTYCNSLEANLPEQRYRFRIDRRHSQYDPKAQCGRDQYADALSPGDAFRQTGTCPDGSGAWTLEYGFEEGEMPPPPARDGTERRDEKRQVYSIIIAGTDEKFGSYSARYALILSERLGFNWTMLEHTQASPLTKDKIQHEVRVVGAQMRPEDFLLVWYCGHGDHNWSFALWGKLFLAANEIFRCFTRDTPAHDIVIVSDACFSEGISEKLVTWSESDEAKRLLRGGRELRHFHSAAKSEDGIYVDFGSNVGLVYTLHVYRGFRDIKVDKENPTAAWLTFNRVLYEHTEGWTLVSGRLLNIAEPYRQHPGFKRVVGEP